MSIGPTHYKGWTCKECNYFEFSPAQIFENQDTLKKHFCKLLNEYIDAMNTPLTCPYIRSAIIERNVEEI